jgi:hypothetical protein
MAINWNKTIYMRHVKNRHVVQANSVDTCEGTYFVTWYAGAGEIRYAFTSLGTPLDDDCHWRPENALSPEIDWTKPIEVVNSTGSRMPAEVIVNHGVPQRVVCWGAGAPGQRARVAPFDDDGSIAGLRVQNVQPTAVEPLRIRLGLRVLELQIAVVDATLPSGRSDAETGFRGFVQEPDGRRTELSWRSDGTWTSVILPGLSPLDLERVPNRWDFAPGATVEPAAARFDPSKPTRTRGGAEVTDVRPYRPEEWFSRASGAAFGCMVRMNPGGPAVESLHRIDGTWIEASGGHWRDLVNFDSAEAVPT